MKVMFSAFGSAGDLFPLVPIAQSLRSRGHEVRWAVPRGLGLYLRSMGWAANTLGDGSEMRVNADTNLFTTAWGGLASWRHLLEHYVRPTLSDDVDRIERLAADWPPDLIVTSSFGVAGRIVAMNRRIRLVECSLYPQHQGPIANSQIAHRFLREVRRLLDISAGDSLARAAWGAPADILFHDPALHACSPSRAVGYPYWDELPSRHEPIERIQAWAGAGESPVVVGTFGSFVGLAASARWDDLRASVRRCGVRAVLVGPAAGAEYVDETFFVVPTYLPLSKLLPVADAVVHHGGLGTSMATLRQGLPAVVIAHAFDQPHNAELLESAGVGIDASRVGLDRAIQSVVADPVMRRAASELSRRLVPPDDAVHRTVSLIETERITW